MTSYSYSGCNTNSASAYSGLINSFANYPIPVWFSEFGCLEGSRTWSEVATIYGATTLTDIVSGGSAFEASSFPSSVQVYASDSGRRSTSKIPKIWV